MRQLLITLLGKLVPVLIDLQQLVEGLRQGVWNEVVPIGATPANAVTVLVDHAIARGWAEALAQKLVAIAPNNPDVQSLRSLMAAQATPATTTDPFQEVLLEGDRPFVGRPELRELLKLVCDGSSTTLLVGGSDKTGKTHSFWLTHHVGIRKGYIASQFEVADYPQPDRLAAEILSRIGAAEPLEPLGVESAERWGEKLATQIANAVGRQKVQRIFVFDKFPRPPDELPAGTGKLVARLAKFAAQELLPYLRVVLIGFQSAALSSDVADIAEQDVAEPFTSTEMLAAFMQVVKARGWPVTEAALRTELDALEAKPGLDLAGRFQFLRKTIRKLAKGTT